jgi:hypothetical protein
LLIEIILALETIKTMLESVPVLFYAATSASFITLLGIGLQNRGESKRNIERLTHDALQRDREREMALRRDVYLRAAEAMAQAQEYLAGFANTEISGQQHESMIKGVGADLNKVHIVGSMPTVQAIVEANQFFVRAVADLSIRKLPVQQLAREIELEQTAVESAIARRDEALAGMKEMSRSTSTGSHARLWELQNRIFNDEQADIDDALARKEQLQEHFSQQQMELLRLSAQAGLEFGRLVTKANLAIRRELELPLDADEYLTLMQTSYDTLSRQVDVFHQRIKQAGNGVSEGGAAAGLSQRVLAFVRSRAADARREARALQVGSGDVRPELPN